MIRPKPVAGQALARSALDRASEHRLDQAWLDAAWARPDTRVLVLAQGRARWSGEAGEPRLALVDSASAPVGERRLLGLDVAGVAYFAVDVEKLPDPAADGHEGGLRELGTLLDDRDAGLLVHATGLHHWHRTHRFCARCGQPTESAAAGHVRRCPACGTEHYPRTDPAVIMLVLDRDDRCLLGRQPQWPERRWSTFAGFVEPGESLEQAVARELHEEVGVVTSATTYVASQPWPFPSSLMLGFLAYAVDDRVRVDGEEIAEARWFTRAEFKEAIDTGEVLMPGSLSIARYLIETWYGGPLDEGNHW
ncbi:NAD(+) diphosphatase [Embleya hyalina]|uniref:NAD(+) diphosphatase n=1 Tax=Embleya hyalina TaxID=516124 RepID=A0A401YL17_9ACTN|nr:NAD(+) diphosphatase [Embleya hyalina]GCD95295.1 NUDIX hydrolase [Embleya hyalina]